MFRGYHWEANPCGKSVFKFDLSSVLDLNQNLKLDNLVQACEMIDTKNSPVALPTPDGKKIVVFSSSISLGGSCDERIDFEMYDSDTNSFSKLPGIPSSLISDYLLAGDTSSTDLSFVTCTFLDESTLLLQADCGLMFSRNLDSPDTGGWKVDETFVGRLPTEGSPCFMIGDELCVADSGIYHINEEKDFILSSYFRLNEAFDVYNYHHGASCVCPLGDVPSNGYCYFCCVQTALDKKTGFPCMIIEVWGWNLEESKQVKGHDQPFKKYLVKSFKFLLDTYGSRPCVFAPLHLSAFES